MLMVILLSIKLGLSRKGSRKFMELVMTKNFLPVAMLKFVRIKLAIASYFDYKIWPMNVKTTFLNGNLEENVYMIQLKGFVSRKNVSKVCKLQRSIYGLKQASRS